MKKLIIPFYFLSALISSAQLLPIKQVNYTFENCLMVYSFSLESGETVNTGNNLPLFSYLVNGKQKNTVTGISRIDERIYITEDRLKIEVRDSSGFERGFLLKVKLTNESDTLLKIENLVPLGIGDDRTYITANGTYDWPAYLTRTCLFRPGKSPIGIVLPDNAWHMGFVDYTVNEEQSLIAMSRRKESDKAEIRRWHALLEPDGYVIYDLYFDAHKGTDYRDGFQIFFRDRWLYDLEEFDNSLFERKDLQWMRNSYVVLLQMAWDKEYYNAITGEYGYYNTILEYSKYFDHLDAYMIWPTWPRLGLDRRNQFDMYRDLPGGLTELKRQSHFAHEKNTKYFISYNPWDQSTRLEDHLAGMTDIIASIDADGVVLDTRGESSKELQAAADKAKPGVVMYSEGMAVPANMPTIVSGRVHNAINMPPPLNMNKYIKPEFGIFRVMLAGEGRLHRESAVSFFNGYGAEINTMIPANPEWHDQDYKYFARMVKILRENTHSFNSQAWLPLVDSKVDSIWVNKFPGKNKTLYTVYSLVPEGYSGELFEVPKKEGFHYVSLWNGRECNLTEENGKYYVDVNIESFNKNSLGTRAEGEVECIAMFPEILNVKTNLDSLSYSADKGSKVIVYSGKPGYDSESAEFKLLNNKISLWEYFPGKEYQFTIQLFDDENILLDQQSINIPHSTPRSISNVVKTKLALSAPAGMVEIPSGEYIFKMQPAHESHDIWLFPDYTEPRKVQMNKYYMDKYPVTNREFKRFIDASGYSPKDTNNFLAHWNNGKIPEGKENHPVVYVSLQDAKEYAEWTGKRLPTSLEWQYAAQGMDTSYKYPWGKELDTTLCNYKSGSTSPVDKYINGASPFGVMDLVGNIWQLTNDIYDNGRYYFVMLRGGSYYNPTASIWYVKGGPWTVDRHKQLLMISPSIDRSATVGFRCVMDAVD